MQRVISAAQLVFSRRWLHTGPQIWWNLLTHSTFKVLPSTYYVCGISWSPRQTFLCSSRPRQPKCIVLAYHDMRTRTSEIFTLNSQNQVICKCTEIVFHCILWSHCCIRSNMVPQIPPWLEIKYSVLCNLRYVQIYSGCYAKREREKGREFIWSPCDTERCLSSALTSEVFGDLSGFFGFGITAPPVLGCLASVVSNA